MLREGLTAPCAPFSAVITFPRGVISWKAVYHFDLSLTTLVLSAP
jgi:hypothetical protein